MSSLKVVNTILAIIHILQQKAEQVVMMPRRGPQVQVDYTEVERQADITMKVCVTALTVQLD